MLLLILSWQWAGRSDNATYQCIRGDASAEWKLRFYFNNLFAFSFHIIDLLLSKPSVQRTITHQIYLQLPLSESQHKPIGMSRSKSITLCTTQFKYVMSDLESQQRECFRIIETIVYDRPVNLVPHKNIYFNFQL